MSSKQPDTNIKSLAGRIAKDQMGKRIAKSKPKRKEKKEKKDDYLAIKSGSNILQEKFDQTLIYKPRTKENRLVYQNIIGKINAIVHDQPQQTILSLADEIIAIIKSEKSQQEKQSDANALIGQKIKHDSFLDLSNLINSLTDYRLEDQVQQLREGIIIQSQGQQDQQNSENQFVQEQQVQQQEEVQEKQAIKKKRQFAAMEEEHENKIDPNAIDAHWLHLKLCSYYDPTVAQSMQRQILEVLSAKTKLQVQNNLLNLLNYEQLELIKLLLENHKVIYLCTKYHQSQNQRQKEQLLEEMRVNNITFGKKHQKKISKKQPNKMEDEVKEQMDIDFSVVKDEEINRLNKKIIDLSIHDSSNRIANKQQYKFKLPEGAEKVEKPGYQEVYIPPKIKKITQNLIQISDIESWMQPVFVGIKRLNPIQSKVYDHTINTNKNMLVCAPTSAGKTNIALLSILQTIKQYRLESGQIDRSKFKIVYIAPMKALVAEITGNLSNKLRQLNIVVKQLTGDMHLTKAQIEQTQVIVATPQKWDIITRKAGDRLFTEQVRLLIIDEIHLLADQRGPVLQSIIARTIRQVQSTQQQVRIVGLSATLPNYADVGALLRIKKKEGLFYFDQSYRPIPLQQLYVGITQKKGVRKMVMINEILYQKVIQRVANNQMIIFVHSRRDTVRTANYLKQTAFAKDQLHKIMKPDSVSKEVLQKVIETQPINSKQLKELLVEGIGVHHAGLSRGDRDLVEQLFADRHLNILVSTATLAWGVNLPAHTVIIKGTQVYSPQQGRWVQLTMQDVMQMLGRAGRPRYDQKGQGIIITGYDQIRYYLGLLNMQIPLQSQLLSTLPDQLNAEIVLGTVSNIKQAVQWLTYTYLFIRMLRNPKYYSIPIQELQEDPQLLKRRVNLIHSAAIILQRNELVNYDRKTGTFNSTFLGKVASYYYIKYPSMKVYNTNLKSSSSLIDLFKIFSMSYEFKYITVREEEKNQLQKLIDSVPVPIKGLAQDPTSKISTLLQAHISRLPLQGYALNVDKVYVTQSASRIMRALFEICLKRGWGQVAQRTLQLAKMIDKVIWSCTSPLRQFKPTIPQFVLNKLERIQQFSWQSFYQMNPQQIGQFSKFPKLGKILHKFVHNVPRVQIDASAKPITRSCLKIDLTIKTDFKWQQQYHGKQEPFWIMVLDCNQQNILYSNYFVLSKDTQTYYQSFITPIFQIVHPLYFIKVISDRWISPDNVLPLSFKNLILPNKFAPPHELLDLQPIPSSHLGPLAKELKISYLNQIQTQTYQAFINTNHNIFLGAAEGSGKFTLALFAINKALQEKEKVIVMLSHKSLVSFKMLELKNLFSKFKVGRTFGQMAKDAITLEQYDLIVTYPQAWDILSRRWNARKGFGNIGLFICQNIHLLNQGSSTMQIVISRMRYISSQRTTKPIRLIALGISIANYKQISQWIGASSDSTFNFHPSVRQNSVEIVFHSFEQYIRQSRIHNMQKTLMHSIKHYNRNSIIFVSDKRQAKLTALDLVSLLSTDINPKRMKTFKDDDIKALSRKLSDQYLIHTLQYGIGFIYDSMNASEKQIIQELFNVGGINILIVTESLKWEVKCKAFIVAVLDCSYFDVRIGRWADFSIPEMIQMMNLAIISQKDKNKGKEYSSSKFIIMCHTSKKNYYKKFLFQPYPVQSTLNMNLLNHLNTGIVAKSIQNKQDCIDWLTWTFMYRRLPLNPYYYHMQDVSELGISTYLSELIENSIQYLQQIKCLQVEDEMNLTPTNLGIICSFYYIKIETLSQFIEKITESIKLKTLLELISQAEQLQDYGYRPKEYQMIGQMLLPLNETAKNKVHGLIQLYLARIPLTSQLQHEVKQIIPTCIKLTHALVNIISSFGYLKSLIVAMQLCQMLVQGMWINDLPLMQVMDKQSAQILASQYNIKQINDFLEMQEQPRIQALKGKDIDKIAQACNRYPLMNLSHEVTDTDEQSVEVLVKLSRDEQLASDLVISGTYPQQKQQLWWIVIGDKKTNRVLTTKSVPVKDQVEISLQFDRIEGVSSYALYALCDSYIGCDQAEQIEISQ